MLWINMPNIATSIFFIESCPTLLWARCSPEGGLGEGIFNKATKGRMMARNQQPGFPRSYPSSELSQLRSTSLWRRKFPPMHVSPSSSSPGVPTVGPPFSKVWKVAGIPFICCLPSVGAIWFKSKDFHQVLGRNGNLGSISQYPSVSQCIPVSLVGQSLYCPFCSSPIHGRPRATWLPQGGWAPRWPSTWLRWARFHLGEVQLRSVSAHQASDCLGTGCVGVTGAPSPEWESWALHEITGLDCMWLAFLQGPWHRELLPAVNSFLRRDLELIHPWDLIGWSCFSSLSGHLFFLLSHLPPVYHVSFL